MPISPLERDTARELTQGSPDPWRTRWSLDCSRWNSLDNGDPEQYDRVGWCIDPFRTFVGYFGWCVQLEATRPVSLLWGLGFP